MEANKLLLIVCVIRDKKAMDSYYSNNEQLSLIIYVIYIEEPSVYDMVNCITSE